MTKKQATGIAATGLLLAAGVGVTPAQDPIQLPDGPSQHVPLPPYNPVKELPPTNRAPGEPVQLPKSTQAPVAGPVVRPSALAVPNNPPQTSSILPSFAPASIAPAACAPASGEISPGNGQCQAGCSKREYFPAPAMGETIAAHFNAMVTNGVAARMTFYDYDFVCGTDKLNYRGRDRVRQIAHLLPQNDFPVIVERTPLNPALADARRLAVLQDMQQIGPVVAARIVVGIPLAYPLNGVEAEKIYQNFEKNSLDFGVYKNWYTTDINGGGSTGGGASGNR